MTRPTTKYHVGQTLHASGWMLEIVRDYRQPGKQVRYHCRIRWPDNGGGYEKTITAREITQWLAWANARPRSVTA